MPLPNRAIVIDTPNGIAMARMLVLKGRMNLELKGIKFRGRSTFTIVKKEFGLKGCREKVLAEFGAMIIRWQMAEELPTSDTKQ